MWTCFHDHCWLVNLFLCFVFKVLLLLFQNLLQIIQISSSNMSNYEQTFKRRKITDFFQSTQPKIVTKTPIMNNHQSNECNKNSDSCLSNIIGNDSEDLNCNILTDDELDIVVSHAFPASTSTSTFDNNSNETTSQISNKNFRQLSDVLTDSNLIDPLRDDYTFILFQMPIDKGERPKPLSSIAKPITGINYVRLPFEDGVMVESNGIIMSRWKLIEELLSSKIESFYQLEKIIKIYNSWSNNRTFDILQQMIDYDDEHFFEQFLPNIIRLALKMPIAFKNTKIPFLEQGTSNAIFLSQHQISILLANAFLCTFHSESNNHTNCINFIG